MKPVPLAIVRQLQYDCVMITASVNAIATAHDGFRDVILRVRGNEGELTRPQIGQEAVPLSCSGIRVKLIKPEYYRDCYSVHWQ